MNKEQAIAMYKEKWAKSAQKIGDSVVIENRVLKVAFIDWSAGIYHRKATANLGYLSALVDTGVISQKDYKPLHEWFIDEVRKNAEEYQSNLHESMREEREERQAVIRRLVFSGAECMHDDTRSVWQTGKRSVAEWAKERGLRVQGMLGVKGYSAYIWIDEPWDDETSFIA